MDENDAVHARHRYSPLNVTSFPLVGATEYLTREIRAREKQGSEFGVSNALRPLGDGQWIRRTLRLPRPGARADTETICSHYNDLVREAGRLLFSGRDSDIFDCGPALVLRRSRRGRSLANEAKVMRFLGERGYPAPRVEELSADGTSLVMQRIEGPTMLEALMRRPWTVGRQAARLAELHQRLHDIPGPDWLEPFLGGGPCIIHRDLHPLNVILSRQGPVLIDWANAARGVGSADVALTWLLMTAAEIPGVGSRLIGKVLRMVFVRSFLAHFDLGSVLAHLSSLAEWKCQDRNMRPTEVAAIRRLVERQSMKAAAHR